MPLDHILEVGDVQGTLTQLEERGFMSREPRSFFLQTTANTEQEGGGVLDVIYRGRVKGGIPAG